MLMFFFYDRTFRPLLFRMKNTRNLRAVIQIPIDVIEKKNYRIQLQLLLVKKENPLAVIHSQGNFTMPRVTTFPI